MPVARCLINGCQWEQYRESAAEATKLREQHERLRHPDVYGEETNQSVEVGNEIRGLASADWWTRAIDCVAGQPPGSRFTLYEICAHLDEPPSSNGWQQLARDAHHLGLVKDVGGVNSKRPGTKGSKTTLWERTALQARGRRTA